MSKHVEQDVAFIRALAELLRETELTEIEVKREYGENDDLEVRLSRAAPAAAVPVQAAPAAAPDPAPAPAPAAPAGPDLSNALTSPMVGTAYLAPEPGADVFVRIGDTVSEGQTVLIIEAMKTMNQIPSPRAGTITEILVTDSEPVEYGQPLVVIA